MNKSLQIYIIKKILRKHGIEPDTIDMQAEVDSKLTLPENIQNILQRRGINDKKAIDEAYEQQKNEELLREYLGMNNIEVKDETKNQTEELIEEEEKIHYETIIELFSKLAKEGKAIRFLSRFIFPELQGKVWKNIRKAVLLLLATQYDMRKRTRIHVLMIGEEGTGKTEALRWIRSKISTFFAHGEHASKVGLVGDARGIEITAGLLADAHQHIICIDELDKMGYRDQDGLLQAMEEGQYTITKGKHREWFDAEVRVFAAANNTNKIHKPLRDRFDFTFELKKPTRDERLESVDAIVDIFFDEYREDKSQILLDYLNWIQDFEPKAENKEEIKQVLKSYIKLTKAPIEEMSYRALEESMLRIAYAVAKLHKRNVTPLDVVEALKMKDSTLNDEQIALLKARAKGVLDAKE